MDIDERRVQNIEDRVRELAQEVGTAGAVNVERQKTLFNTLGSIEVRVGKLDDRVAELAHDIHVRMDNIRTVTNKRLDGWLTAIAGASVLSTGTLALLIITRGLK